MKMPRVLTGACRLPEKNAHRSTSSSQQYLKSVRDWEGQFADVADGHSERVISRV
jgi:hypothetical protein